MRGKRVQCVLYKSLRIRAQSCWSRWSHYNSLKYVLEGNAPSLCSYSELLSSNHNAVVVNNDCSEDFAPVFVVVVFFSQSKAKDIAKTTYFFLRPLYYTLLISYYCSARIHQSPRGSSNKEAICSQTWLCHKHSTLDSKRSNFR